MSHPDPSEKLRQTVLEEGQFVGVFKCIDYKHIGKNEFGLLPVFLYIHTKFEKKIVKPEAGVNILLKASRNFPGNK